MPTKFPLIGRVPKSRWASAPKATGPTINRGRGNNAATTPWKFVKAVENKFGPLGWDLAASEKNSRVGFGHYFDEKANSLVQSWAGLGLKELAWLNPPYFNITPWARKCAEEVQLGARILLLVPASVGANWYWDWVAPYADVYSVGRMVFDDRYDKHGELITTPYPKDLVLAHYDWSREAEKAGRRTGDSYADHHLGGRAELIRWRWQNGR